MKCPGCGGDLRYDIKAKRMVCGHCSNQYDPYEVGDGKLGAAMSAPGECAAEGGVYQTRVYVCPSCGAELDVTDETDITAVCQYCGSGNIIYDRIRDSECPERIIPFSVTKEGCKKAYLRAARRAILTPKALKDPARVDSFRGIYMPYWSYDVELDEPIAYETKAYDKTAGDYKYYNVSGYDIHVQAKLRGFTHDASGQFNDEISECLAPYPPAEEKPFAPGFLSGFYAETADMYARETLSDRARTIVEGAILSRLKILERLKSAQHDIVDPGSVRVPSECVQTKRVMYPVWFMSYRKNDEQMTYATVNGATGKVVADFPVSLRRFGVFALLLAAVIYVLMNLSGFMGRPFQTMGLTFLMLCFSVVFNYMVSVRPKAREEKKRAVSPSGRYARSVLFMAGGSILFFLLALLLNGASNGITRLFCYPALVVLLVFLIKSANANLETAKKKWVEVLKLIGMGVFVLFMIVFFGVDVPNGAYYLVSVVCILLFFLYYIPTLRRHNAGCYRQPPQFNKKGGDDRA